MREFTRTPIYGGARHNAGQVPQGAMPRDLTNSALVEGAEAVRGQLGALERTMKRYEDAGQAMEEDAAMRLVEQRYLDEFDKRLQLANGAEGSFFEADGSKREIEFQNFMSAYKADIGEATKGGYWTADVGQAASFKREARIAAFPLQLEEARARQTHARGMKAFSDSYDLALAQDDYQGAKAAVDTALAAGLISDKEAQLHKLRVGKRISARAAAAANDSRRTQDAGEMEASTLAALQDRLISNPRPETPQSKRRQEASLLFSSPSEPAAEQGYTVSSDVLTLDNSLLSGDFSSAFAVGVRAYSDDEVATQLEEAELAHGRPTVSVDPSTGAAAVAVNSDTPEVLAAHSVQANKEGGYTIETYRSAIWAAGVDLLNNPMTRDMTKEHAKSAFVKRVQVIGLAEILFPDNPDGMTSLLDGVFEMLWETRDAEIAPRVKELCVGGKDGLPGTKGLIDAEMRYVIGQNFKPSSEQVALAGAEYSWTDHFAGRGSLQQTGYNPVIVGSRGTPSGDWRTRRERMAAGFRPLWEKHKARFAHETGTKLREDGKDLTHEPDTVRAFQKWYFAPGGVYETERADYIRHVEELCVQKATEAVARYRVEHQEVNWAEEQRIIVSTVDEVVKGLSSDRNPWATYRQHRGKELEAQAAQARAAYEKVKPRLEAEQAAAVQREQEAKERARAEANEAEARKKEEEQVAQEKKKREEAHATRFTRSAGYSLRFDRNAKEEGPTIYVPVSDYAEMCSQLGVTDGDNGVICTINGGSTLFVVMPAEQEGMSYNIAAFNKIYSARTRKGMTSAQIGAAANGAVHNITFKRF